MISLKFTKKQRKEEMMPCCGPDNDEEYPYETQMRFNRRIVEQSDVLKNAEVGDKIMVTVEAKVRKVEKIDRVEGKKDDHTVELQFEDIDFKKAAKTGKGSSKALGIILGEKEEEEE